MWMWWPVDFKKQQAAFTKRRNLLHSDNRKAKYEEAFNLYLVNMLLPSPASNNGKQDLLCEWVRAKTWQSCSECGELTQDGSQLLTSCNICATPGPNLMCKRRKLQKNSVIVFPAEAERDEVSLSTVRRGPSETTIQFENNNGVGRCERDLGGVNAFVFTSQKLDDDYSRSQKKHSRTVDINFEPQFVRSDKELRSDGSLSLESEMGVGSITRKTEVIDLIECPSAVNLRSEVVDDDSSIRDLCITVLKRHGLLGGDWHMRSSASSEALGISTNGGFTQSCKLCGNSEDTLNMLLCDHCEEAFHETCCNPKIKILPIDEWFCPPCSKMNSSFMKSPSICWSNGTCKFDIGSIATMLKHPEPYTSRVRIGKSFQAEVPDWSDQISNDVDCIGEPLEMDPAEAVALNVCRSKPNSISNWLQCRETLYDATGECIQGTICGKWRRAPFSEVQTDDWDCSCSMLWDPFYSDCAVPQELETDEVLAHLKYMEQLRSRVAARKPNSNRTIRKWW